MTFATYRKYNDVDEIDSIICSLKAEMLFLKGQDVIDLAKTGQISNRINELTR